jgi:aspartate aminotransferase
MPKELIPHFNAGTPIPPDPILGISARYKKDPREEKIDAGVGVFRMVKDKRWLPFAIREAKNRVDPEANPQGYVSAEGESEWTGIADYLLGTAKVVFGPEAVNLLGKQQLSAVATSGGTGALAIYAEIMRERNPDDSLLISKPTWGPHRAIFGKRKINILEYNHVIDNEYDFESHLDAIKKSPENTRVLFHTGKTHNPSGVNPLEDVHWRTLARNMEGRKAIFDTAYAGFVDGLEEDTKPIRIFMEEGISLAVAFSYSKNAGLYDFRTGVLLIPSPQDRSLDTQRLENSSLRILDSTAPAPGQNVMEQVYTSPYLREEWNINLRFAASTLRERRELMAKHIPQFDFLTKQYGLFSFLPLSPGQVERLEKEEAVYMTTDGRVNLGGVQTEDIERLSKAILRIM